MECKRKQGHGLKNHGFINMIQKVKNKTNPHNMLIECSASHIYWYSKTKLWQISWKTMKLLYRFLNPCLILVHADLLPTGVYWRALRLLVPLIVHVQRQPPARVFGKLLGFVQHQADIARLEALRGKCRWTLSKMAVLLSPFKTYNDYS